MANEDSALQIIKERISSPITGTFIFSWLIYNWRIPIMTFNNDFTSKYKIEWIENYILENAISSFAVPFFFMCIYVIGMPYLREIYSQYIYNLKIKTDVFKFNSDQDLTELRTYRQTILNITIDLIREMEGIKKESENISAEIKIIDDFASEEFEKIKKSSDSIANSVDSKIKELRPLFHMNNTSYTVKNQIENFHYLLNLKYKIKRQ